MDGYQVQLDRPLLMGVGDIDWQLVQFHWQRNCALTNLHNIMFDYVNKPNAHFMDMKFIVNGLANQFSYLEGLLQKVDNDENKRKSTSEPFFENFVTSIMVICIRDGIASINDCLCHKNDEDLFKLLYFPSAVNLLSLLNAFWSSQKGGIAVGVGVSVPTLNLDNGNYLLKMWVPYSVPC